MGIIGRRLPGEWEGTINLRDLGFGVIEDTEELFEDERRRRVAAFYLAARTRTGVIIPSLEEYLSEEPLNPESM